MTEISKGIGARWADYPLVGATRGGVAPAKEGVGKQPERYKLVAQESILYNPMRIMLGSIGMIDVDEVAGITSPDYVVFRGLPNVIHTRWFYYWFRSSFGGAFVKAASRGAVRERLLFNRLKEGVIQIPSWEVQVATAGRLHQIRHLKQKLTSQLETINAMPAALLREAFSGKL